MYMGMNINLIDKRGFTLHRWIMKNKTCLLTMVIFVLVLSGCAQNQAVPTPTSTPVEAQAVASPTSQPVESLEALLSTPQVLPPVVSGYSPGMGEEALLNAEIAISFDQWMDPEQTAAAFQMVGPDREAVLGKISWTDQGKTLRFKPSQPLEPASDYEITVEQSAASQDNIKMEDAYSFHIHTITPLQVGQVFPVDGADQVEPDSQVTVIFNRPVVALGISEEQPTLVPAAGI